MAQSAVEVVRALQPAPDVDMTELFQRDADPDVVEAALAELSEHLTADFVCASTAVAHGERRGAAGLRNTWLDWLEPWDSYRAADHDFIEVDDERVLVLVRDFGRPRGMDSEVELLGSALYTVRDGKIARVEFFAQRADAYAAAGIDPPE